MKTVQRADKVDRVIVEMLLENTGTSFLDSGGDYGRAWQKNQGRTLKDFMKSKKVIFDVDYGYTINLFHYLRRALQLDAVCEKFNRRNHKAKDWDFDAIHGVSGEAGAYLEGLGAKIGEGFNSYNGESSLSQVIQGAWLDINGKRYLALQIHGGCDVRGGYTNARLFLVNDYEDGALLERVYGSVTKKDGTVISVDNEYDGVSLTDENGQTVEIVEGDKVELELASF